MAMRLMTWNTQWCCGIDGRVDPSRIVREALAIADPDVLCLQEIAVHFPRLKGSAGGDQVHELAALLPGWTVLFGAAVERFDAAGRTRSFGNLIATRLPVAEVRRHALPWPAAAGQRSMPRACLEVTLQATLAGAPRWLRVLTTHLAYHVPAQRLAQAERLRALQTEAVERAAGTPQAADDGSPFEPPPLPASALLCGDFNARTDDAAYAALQAPAPGHGQVWCDAWPVVHGSRLHAPTFQLHERSLAALPYACDFVFVTPDLAPAVRRIEVDAGTQASDHQPVWVELD